MPLSAITVDTQDHPEYAVIWLHGLGASGHDFEPIVEQLDLPKNLRVRFIFPHAPKRPITLNNGLSLQAWYDIFGLDMHSPQDEHGLLQSSSDICELIDQLVKSGIPAQRIILAGFSQGGAQGLYTGLSCNYRLAGILAISCWLPLHQKVPDYATKTDRSLAILLLHGMYDVTIPFSAAEFTRETLEQQGFTVTLKSYPCAHTVSPEEVRDIRDWLLKCWK